MRGRSSKTRQYSGGDPSSRLYGLSALILVGWIALIFGTSSTVIRPQEFFAWFREHVFVSDAAFERFQVFWGVSWFAIVKGWHALEFAVLLLLCVGVIRWWTGCVTPGRIVFAMLCCIAFAVSDEWHQSFIPDRFGTVSDVLIDALGVCIAGGILLRQAKRPDGRTRDGLETAAQAPEQCPHDPN